MKKLDVIYNKLNQESKPLLFSEILDIVLKEETTTGNEEQIKIELYNGLLFDKRFVMLPEMKWSLTEMYSLDELKEITNSNFGEVSEEDEEEEKESATIAENENDEIASKDDGAEEIEKSELDLLGEK